MNLGEKEARRLRDSITTPSPMSDIPTKIEKALDTASAPSETPTSDWLITPLELHYATTDALKGFTAAPTGLGKVDWGDFSTVFSPPGLLARAQKNPALATERG